MTFRQDANIRFAIYNSVLLLQCRLNFKGQTNDNSLDIFLPFPAFATGVKGYSHQVAMGGTLRLQYSVNQHFTVTPVVTTRMKSTCQIMRSRWFAA